MHIAIIFLCSMHIHSYVATTINIAATNAAMAKQHQSYMSKHVSEENKSAQNVNTLKLHTTHVKHCQATTA